MRRLLALAVLGLVIGGPGAANGEERGAEKDAPAEHPPLPDLPPDLRERFDVLAQQAAGLDEKVLTFALRAFVNARARHEVRRNRLSIIDFSLPSTEKRLWLLDLDNNELLLQTLVAHGRGSGDKHSTTFSNEHGSLQSSLGTFLTGATYHGKHGYSLKLEGLEPGINDETMARTIVIHGADYVSEDFARRYGRIGRSWGCPAVPLHVTNELIDAIKGGTVLFAWYPDPEFEGRSTYID